MEATLQRQKPKKHRTKTKQTVQTKLELDVKPVSENVIENEEKDSKVAEEGEETQQLCDPVEIKPSAIVQEIIVKNACDRNLEKNFGDIGQNLEPLSHYIDNCEVNDVHDTEKNVDTVEIVEDGSNQRGNISNQISAGPVWEMSSSELVYPEKVSKAFTKEIDSAKLKSLHIYPDLKSLQHCEQMHNIISSQTLVKTYSENYRHKAAIEANKGFQEFMKVLQDLDKHPLMEMIHQYQRSKKSSLEQYSRLKYLKSDLKRKKDSLWLTVKKETSAKGKCEDGYTVNIKHSYTIKELNKEKFDELKRILKEMEELLLSYAFHSYSEEVTKLRIEHFIHGLIETEKPQEFQESFSGALTAGHESAPFIYKKCISILFDSQRQNVQDKQYLNTCQKWLKTMISKSMQSWNFKDNLFLINHVLRCPGGIDNWAAEIVQVPMNIDGSEDNEVVDDACAQQILLALFIIMKPVPYRDFYLKHIKDSLPVDPDGGKFIVLDSDGEEEDLFEVSKNWSDSDVVALLHQIPIRSLFKHILLDDSGDLKLKQLSEGKMLKLFAYSSAIIDVLFDGLQTYSSESFPLLFESISNLIRHILLYLSNYWTNVNMTIHFKSQLQAVYDKLFFHIVFKIYNFEKLHIWKILPSLPYDHVSEKMLWNILWIFFSPGKPEEQIYSEKDVEIKIKDESIHSVFVNHIKKLPVEDVIQLVYAIEKIIISKNSAIDLIQFLYYMLFKISVLEQSLMATLFNEVSIILRSISERYPYLVSLLLRKIDENDDEIIDHCLTLFEKINLSHWVPEDGDIRIISSWLLSNLTGKRNHLARLILKNMNWSYNSEGLFLPYELHKQIAIVVSEAYLKFDANNSSEGLISKGVKQILQFTSIGGQKDEEKFVHWAWNILFCLKLHPLDTKFPPWVQVYDGYIEERDKSDVNSDLFQALLSASEKKHPAGCYLMLVIEGHSLKNLTNKGLDFFSGLVECEQYMAAIKSLYYILPFFVKNSDLLLEKIEFIKAMSYLITADLTVLSNITGEVVIGAVLHQIAAMIKFQIYQAAEQTIECAAPLIKLWIKILMKMLSPPDKNVANILKNSAKQIHFLLDVIVKISYLHDYTRDCTLDLLSSYCDAPISPRSSQLPLWNRLFYSNSSVYAILNRHTISEYPWLSWYVLFSEMKQKNVQALWLKVQKEMSRQSNGSPAICLKKVSDGVKVDVDFLPIYRWAFQAVAIPASHPVAPLIWQQFFLYYFHKVPSPNGSIDTSSGLGTKYFKNEPFVALFKKIKKHLTEAHLFYMNLLKTPECESSGGERNGLHLINLQKLFLAFQLWIDDEALQSSSLCLSALEPKYCPHRLKLILMGDQNLWYDMTFADALKEEINQKVHSWCFQKIPSETPRTSPKFQEALPQMISRHLINYENVLPAVNVDCSPTTVLMPEISDFSSTSAPVVQLIEQKQSIIFDKAKYFCDQMNILKQLNFNFINWVPQEYEVLDTQISQEKACSKGHDCAGLARFRLQIQTYRRNERIAERIDNNRANFLVVQDQLSKLPVKDLCMASLQIESIIRCLACKMKNTKNGDSNHFKKLGVSLFHHQISTIDKTIASVAGYPASRQFYSSIIESLGREFIDGNESELLQLARAILTHPEAGSLALPLFDPNKSGVCNFLQVYGLLTSSIGHSSANTLIALFSKVDFSFWLNKNAPNFDTRKYIFEYICEALQVCGFEPSTELLPLFYILKRHFGIILKYMFPELFVTAVTFLLNGAESKNLSIEVFYEAFHCFGCPLFSDKTNADDTEIAIKNFAQNQRLPADQQIFVSVARLNLQQVIFATQIFYNKFLDVQNSCVMYKNYASYIKPLGIFLSILSHSLIALYLDEFSSRSQTLSFEDILETFHLPYSLLLHPKSNSCGLDFPWTNEQTSHAQYLFKIFISSVKYFHSQFLDSGSGNIILSYIWNFYVERYVKPGYRHYSVALCHSELLNLPWNLWHPCTVDIEEMCAVLQSNLDESKEFLSKISLKIPWSEVMQSISLTRPPVYVGKVLATLGKLLIISQLNCTEIENCVYPSVFKEFEALAWHFLCMEDIEVLSNLFYSNADFFVLVSKWDKSTEFHVLQFLKQICCIVPNPDAGHYSNSKRIIYLHQFLSKLSLCCVSKSAEMLNLISNFKNVISSLCEELHIVVSNGVNPNEQTNCALPIMKEIIRFLNDLPCGEFDKAALNSITAWLSAHKQTPLLFPILKTSSCNLNSMAIMVPLIECCISTRFSDESLDAHEARTRWQMISSYFSVRSNIMDEFVIKCVEENAYLSLYCCLLHKLPHCTTTESRRNLLERIVQWIRDSKLSSEAEAKFLLLWDKLFDLCTKLVLEEEFMVVRQELTSFCWTLDTLAEDRSNSGFFSYIGFGQASCLSVNFRFLCRVMTAFLQNQIPANRPIRMEPLDSDNVNGNSSASSQEVLNSTSAAKALDNLKALQQKKLYSALQPQIDYATKCISDPKYTFRQTRELLKYFAVILYPKDSYLSVLDS